MHQITQPQPQHPPSSGGQSAMSPSGLRPVPVHIAMIMDGNGRWAGQRGQARSFGHKQGVEAVRHVVAGAEAAGVRYLTLFGFSTENWTRPPDEVGFLMGLLKSYFTARFDELMARNIRVRIIGEPRGFDPQIQAQFARAQQESKNNTGLQVIVALNYGGRDEIMRAVRRAARAGVALADDGLDAATLSQYMDAPDVPDPDLVIRTSGEQRLSNFLLWQSAYAELYFTPVLWPDMTAEHVAEAIAAYQHRQRRFGGVAGNQVLRAEADV